MRGLSQKQFAFRHQSPPAEGFSFVTALVCHNEKECRQNHSREGRVRAIYSGRGLQLLSHLKRLSPNYSSRCLRIYLECDDEVEEEHHVDDAVDDGLLHGHHEEQNRTHDDPVLGQKVPDPRSCSEHSL